ncbi:MAG: hypothetical protein ACD_50C00007G0007 [uncultured bacterium]|nr:MAG: hypothetical protein ACD_50C00007G0007 [uncultured bacterium]OGH13525.1 MAG: 16S rRNA (cytidine(1402)-2'-O)-methyltransferase [Candidatus Levybacteria bacterium RIFCSPHIGHO2_01_FULL_38_26]
MGTLYIVATPIGNLKDLSYRAVDTLGKVQIIACEDTRRTGLLLKYISSQQDLNTKPTLLSYFEQNEFKRIPQIINSLKNGLNVALVSDAGTPTISDPGFKLVRECIAQGIRVESIPGPSSVISAIAVSGLPTDKFLFLGYLPKKQGKRVKLLNELKCFETLKQVHPTIIFFESPHRLLKTLQDLRDVLGDIRIVICRELTKVHEETRRENISSSIEHFNKVVPKGEFVLLFN